MLVPRGTSKRGSASAARGEGDLGLADTQSNSGLRGAVFPGSFDPLTNGHVDIITRALSIFDHVTIGVLLNPEKTTLFSVEERVSLIQQTFAGYENVTVESFSGLLVDFARERDVQVVLRGLRAISDYDYEAQLALMNKSLCGDIETFFMMTTERYSYVSSSLVKQVASYGGSVSKYVPAVIETALKGKL
jgi:pantetheine-phosphate adenylyltransferase